jgi:LysM repeat protein
MSIFIYSYSHLCSYVILYHHKKVRKYCSLEGTWGWSLSKFSDADISARENKESTKNSFNVEALKTRLMANAQYKAQEKAANQTPQQIDTKMEEQLQMLAWHSLTSSSTPDKANPITTAASHLTMLTQEDTLANTPKSDTLKTNVVAIDTTDATTSLVRGLAARGTTEPLQSPKISTDYTIESGDTLWAIAKKNNMTLEDLRRLNPDIVNVNMIKVGQVIKISPPDVPTTTIAAPTRSAEKVASPALNQPKASITEKPIVPKVVPASTASAVAASPAAQPSSNNKTTSEARLSTVEKPKTLDVRMAEATKALEVAKAILTGRAWLEGGKFVPEDSRNLKTAQALVETLNQEKKWVDETNTRLANLESAKTQIKWLIDQRHALRVAELITTDPREKANLGSRIQTLDQQINPLVITSKMPTEMIASLQPKFDADSIMREAKKIEATNIILAWEKWTLARLKSSGSPFEAQKSTIEKITLLEKQLAWEKNNYYASAGAKPPIA